MPTINQLIRKGRKKVSVKSKSPALKKLSAAARGLYTGNDTDTEEAEFCPAQSGKSTVTNGQEVMPTFLRRAQSPGALDRARARGA